jgi:hypothetical protein
LSTWYVLAGAHDQVADAGDRGVEIGEHHADQGAPERQPQARSR